MRILGVDYGRKKIGLAFSEGKLAEPLKVIRANSFAEAISKTQKIIQEMKIEKVIVGVSEGEMAKESEKFAKNLNAETYDETLTSIDAIRLSINSGIKRIKRKEMEDAYAASIMLQNYLDSA